MTCMSEKLSLRASLLSKALPWKESLWDDFFTLGLPKLPCGPHPKSALEPGLQELNPAPLRCWVGKWGAPNSAVKVAARSQNIHSYSHTHRRPKQARASAHARTHTRVHARTHARTRSDTHEYAHTRMHSRTFDSEHALTRTRTHPHAYTRSRARAHTHATAALYPR